MSSSPLGPRILSQFWIGGRVDGSEYLNSSLESVTQYPPFLASSLSLGVPEAPLWAPKGPQYTVLELLGGGGLLPSVLWT